MSTITEKRVARWYFGGLAGSAAACCTHPLDLLKVHMQTQTKGRVTLGGMAVQIVKTDGVLGLYSGLSASIVRQLTYTTTRIAIYEVVKQSIPSDGPLPFYQKVALAAFAGGCGGFVGTPGDMVNVRMQNDMKLPVEKRRGYKHALDGMYRVAAEEGPTKLFNGAAMATNRAIFMTIGQVSCYDQVKEMLMNTGAFGDNITTHFTASTIAAGIATVITQPMDVMKTRMMNAKPGEFKGTLPAFVRLAPHTILLWVFMEQLRLRFGARQK